MSPKIMTIPQILGWECALCKNRSTTPCDCDFGPEHWETFLTTARYYAGLVQAHDKKPTAPESVPVFGTIQVQPLEMTETVAFVVKGEECKMEEVLVGSYPPSEHQALRKFRTKAKLSLGDAGRILGMGPSFVSEIERGARKFIDDETYGQAVVALTRRVRRD